VKNSEKRHERLLFQTGENEVNKQVRRYKYTVGFFWWGKMEVIFGYSNLVSFAFRRTDPEFDHF